MKLQLFPKLRNKQYKKLTTRLSLSKRKRKSQNVCGNLLRTQHQLTVLKKRTLIKILSKAAPISSKMPTITHNKRKSKKYAIIIRQYCSIERSLSCLHPESVVLDLCTAVTEYRLLVRYVIHGTYCTISISFVTFEIA